jgi:hypothetical protein
VALAAFAAGALGGGSVESPVGAGETIFDHSLDDVVVSVTSHATDDALCAQDANGKACTSLDATEPMVSTTQMEDGRVTVVVVDAQRRIDAIKVPIGGKTLSVASTNGGLSAEVLLNDAPSSVEVLDVNGKLLTSVEPALDAETRMAEEAADSPPEH